MSLLWSFEAVSAWRGAPQKAVQYWASEWLERFYPDRAAPIPDQAAPVIAHPLSDTGSDRVCVADEAWQDSFLSEREDLPEEDAGPEDEDWREDTAGPDPIVGPPQWASNVVSAAFIARCIDLLTVRGHPARRRIVSLLGDLRIADAAPALVDLFLEDADDESDDAVYEAVETAVRHIGAPMWPEVQRVLNEGTPNQIQRALVLTAELPYPDVAAFLTREFTRLYDMDAEFFLYVIQSLAAAEFIPPLHALLKEGEYEEEVYALLCRLHGVEDPRLPEMERQVEERMEAARVLARQLLEHDGPMPALEEIPLHLRCRKCGWARRYPVREAMIDPEDREIENLLIRDELVCKECGAANQMDITPKGRKQVIFQLNFMMKNNHDRTDGPIQVTQTLADGRPMSLSAALKHYQDEVALHPEHPDLRVGYGNLLAFMKRSDEALLQFQAAVEMDPLALEAVSALAKTHEEMGETHLAAAGYERCLTQFNRGHFYRMKDTKKEQFKEYLEWRVWELRQELGMETDDPAAHTVSAGPKVGRNDPCPCGSGKKYKKCCLNASGSVSMPKPPPPETMQTEDEQRLLRKLIAFATGPQHQWEAKKAVRLYFNTTGGADEAWKEEEGKCLEWFIYDYRLQSGRTPAEAFSKAEGGRLPTGERQILQDSLGPALSLYEVLDVHPEMAEIHILDLVTEETLRVYDVSGSKHFVKWDLLCVRVVPIKGRLRFSGFSTVFPPSSRDALLDYFTSAFHTYREEQGETDWKGFMKARGYLVQHYLQACASAQANRPEAERRVQTQEGHEMVPCVAHYDLLNDRRVLARLRDEYDFILEDEENHKTTFQWLARGASKSAVPEEKSTGEEKGLRVMSSVFPTPLSEGVVVLGTGTLTEKRLTLEVMSRERLAAGKSRLADLLREAIRHRVDTFESMDSMMERGEKRASRTQAPSAPVPLSPEMATIIRRMAAQYSENWVTSPIPMFGGKTPKEMVQSSEGRAQVVQFLKEVENREERRQQKGEGFSMDASLIRTRLGLTSDAPPQDEVLD